MKTSINNRNNRISNELIPRLQNIPAMVNEKDLVVQNAIKILEEKFFNNANSLRFLSSTSSSRRVGNLLNKCLEESLTQLGLFNHINKVPSKIGFFYIISNKNFPNYYKVGHSKDAETRLNQYQTYSPFRDFKLEKYLVVLDSKLAESAVLSYFSNSLTNEWLYSTDISKDFSVMAKIISDITGLPNRWALDNIPEELLEHFRYIRDKK
jgi:hypothetical protein